MNDRRLLVSLMCGLFLTAAPVTGRASGQQLHLGVATCASSLCHGSAKPLKATAVLQNEYVTWSHFDPHARAWSVLLEERARLIAKRLGIPRAEQASQCLGCHSDDVPAAARGERFQLSDGVGCEACHGGAEDWLASHYDTPRVSHQVNLRAGMYPMDVVRTRAERCLDCHQGSVDHFASHRLMAAGHPRLSFELDTYTELWRTSGGHEHYRVDDDYRLRKPGPTGTQVWLSGLLASGARQLRLLDSPAFLTGGGLPDFAFFNCYSCHRTMGLKRWQERSADLGREPGALRLDDTTWRLLGAAADALHSGEADALRRSSSAVQAAIGSNRTALAAAVADAGQTLDAMRRSSAGADTTPAMKRELLTKLLQAGARGDFPDYASAEQLAMAITVLASDTGEGDKLRSGLDTVFGALSDDDQYDRRRFIESLRRIADRQDAADSSRRPPH